MARLHINLCRWLPTEISPEDMFKRAVACALAWILLAVISLSSPLAISVRAESLEEEVNKRIDRERKQLEQLRSQIEKRSKTLADAAKDEESARSALQVLEEKIRLLNKEQSLLKLELEKTEQNKTDLEEKAADIEQRLKLGEAVLAKRLRAIYKAGNFSYLKASFSSEDFAQFLRQFRYARIISRLDAELLKDRTTRLSELKAGRAQIEESQKEIKAKKETIAEKSRQIGKATEEKRDLLTKIKKEIESQENQLAILEKASARVSFLINELLEKSKVIGEDQSADKTASSDVSKSIVAKRGNLPWPTKGKVVAQFGTVKNPKFKTYTTSKGINIRAPFGSEVKAVGPGVVLFADNFRGYGKLLILDHGDGYYSLYGYVSEILVRVGQKVEQGKTVAKVGRDKDIGISALYFEMRNHGIAEDPMEWLEKRG